MLKRLLGKIRLLRAASPNGFAEAVPLRKDELSGNLNKDLSLILGILGSSKDILVRKFAVGKRRAKQAAVVFIEGMVDRTGLSENVLRPLMLRVDDAGAPGSLMDYVESRMITFGDVRKAKTAAAVVDSVLSGDAALLIDGFAQALLVGTRRWEQRNVEEPETEVIVRGPREGFTENLRVNIVLLRRIIRNPALTFRFARIGSKTNTSVCMVYLKGTARDAQVEEVARRLRRIRTPAILESGYIEQFIEDNPFSPFSTVGNSERPDKVAAKILEGKIAILTDGTPFALTVPMLFIESFQSSEDYYSRPYYATIVRWVRYLGYGISVTAPATYVAFTMYHRELIPRPLLLTMAAAREGVPFPAAFEAIGMLLVFEILREAGVRLPRPVGQAVSIVGALVIGEAAVRAGLIGAPMVIVVAITAISSFVVPAQIDSSSFLRLVFTVSATLLGAFGVGICFLATLIHLTAIRSFGAPYLSPIAPLNVKGLRDTLARAPVRIPLTRPTEIDRDSKSDDGDAVQ